MGTFSFNNTTDLHFGRNTQFETGKLAKQWCKTDTVMVVSYAGRPLTRILDDIETSLREEGFSIVEFEGVVPNPVVSKAREGIELARAHNVGLVIGVGGGSCIDTAKAIAVGVHYPGDIWELYEGAEPCEILPVGAVMTLAGTGSESSIFAVLTNEDIPLKIAIGYPEIRPKFAILNPEYTFSVNPYQTAAGACDMFAHILDTYLSKTDDEVIFDRIGEAVMKTVKEFAPIAVAEPENYEAREQLMICGTLAMGKFATMGLSANLGLHTLAEDLGAVYNVTHGAALTALIPAWMTYLIPQKKALLTRYATQVWGIEPDQADSMKTLWAGIRATAAFFKSVGMPTSLHELGIDFEKDGRMLAERVTGQGDFGDAYVDIYADDIYKIYELAK